MSRFYASIQGNRGEATRAGHSSIRGHIRGWHVGVQVRGEADPGDGEDVFYVYATSGSSARQSPQLLGTVQLIGDEPIFTAANDRMLAV